MKSIVISSSASMGNIVRGALRETERKIMDHDVVTIADAAGVSEKITDDSVIFIDWEDKDPIVNATRVAMVKEAIGERHIPILLIATKLQAKSTFSGMKAGACAVIYKPIDPGDLRKVVHVALKQKRPASGKKVNVEFINPFIEATRAVFQTMLGMTIERKKLFLKEDYKMLGDISGVMGLSGTACGSVVISLPSQLARQMVGKMLGEPPPGELNADVCDAVGEIVNMIAGQAKAAVVETKYYFHISIPTVVRGAGHEVTHKQGTPNVVVLFETEGQTFAIQVCLEPSG